MLKNYFKIAFRSLLKNRLFSIINLSGLAIGMASFILIMLYVGYEKSYDRFYEKSDNIYRVYMDYQKGGEFEAGDAQTYNLAGPFLKEQIPEVIDFVRFFQLTKTAFEYNNEIFEISNGHLADPSFFKVFKSGVLEGNSAAMNNPNSIVLTKSIAYKIFGNENPIGKSIDAFRRGKKTSLQITGLIDDIPKNTHLKINFLISHSTFKNWNVFDPQTLNWNNNNHFTYLLVKEGVDTEVLRQKVFEAKAPIENERQNIEPLTDIHLHSQKPFEAETNGNANSIRFLFAISVFIILLSWLNYISLTSAKMFERTIEVGIRKVTGAKRMQLVTQLMSETFILNLLALFIALSIVVIALPSFQAFIGKNITLSSLSFGQISLLIGIPFLGIGLSGIYPAFLLSSFAPIKILKGKLMAGVADMNLKKGIVGLQFLVTISLLIGSITIFKQMKHINDLPIDMTLNNSISIKSTILDQNKDLGKSFQVLKQEIKNLSFVKNAALTSTYPGEGWDHMSTFVHVTFPDGTRDLTTNWNFYEFDESYIPTMGFRILAGNNFSKNEKSNQNKIIINETTTKLMGFSNPKKAVNKEVQYWGTKHQIIGVIKDYHHFGLKSEPKPFIFQYSSNEKGLVVKLNDTQSISEIGDHLELLQSRWTKVFPKSTFRYQFIDEQFASLYSEEKKFGQTFTLFTLLAIIIATMGLFGLSYYQINQRIKEVGIRKVNGAKVSEILTMLNKNFIKWVIIAFVIACPLTYYAMSKWLENFAYKTTLSWWIFALAGVLAIGIALFTVSFQSYKAATRNPIESLRYE